MPKPHSLLQDLFAIISIAAFEPQRNLHFPLFRHAGMRVHPNPTPRRGRPRGHDETATCGDRPGSDVCGVGREISRKPRPRRFLVSGKENSRADDSQLSFGFGELIADAVVVVGGRGVEAACASGATPDYTTGDECNPAGEEDAADYSELVSLCVGPDVGGASKRNDRALRRRYLSMERKRDDDAARQSSQRAL